MAGKLIADTLESAAGGRPAVTKGAFCLAWAHFTGGTGAVNKSFNISSITRNGAGDYTANFTTAMVDTSYVALGAVGDYAAGTSLYGLMGSNVTARTVSAYRFYFVPNSGASGDSNNSMIAFFGTN